ncbi:hypothetical protein GCM10009680_40930 [Streptomyces yatensis]|uniref:Uncharacterized protein n=1 Tax=Streptomyces yatensis TaxID=155177 RepID=A0ABN2I0K7_9ACTN
MRWSFSAKTVSLVYFPDSSPDASGTRAMIPTPASRAAGTTSSSGLSRNGLRMICTLAVPGRAIAASASAHVSTLTPYAATRSSATSVSSASKTASEECTGDGGQCSCTRSRVSTPRLARDRSVHARKLSRV